MQKIRNHMNAAIALASLLRQREELNKEIIEADLNSLEVAK